MNSLPRSEIELGRCGNVRCICMLGVLILRNLIECTLAEMEGFWILDAKKADLKSSLNCLLRQVYITMLSAELRIMKKSLILSAIRNHKGGSLVFWINWTMWTTVTKTSDIWLTRNAMTTPAKMPACLMVSFFLIVSLGLVVWGLKLALMLCRLASAVWLSFMSR